MPVADLNPGEILSNVFYINRGNFEYVRIASFSEYRENEMVFGFFSINSEEDPWKKS